MPIWAWTVWRAGENHFGFGFGFGVGNGYVDIWA